MNAGKFDLIEMYIERIKLYSTYVSCLTRVTNDLIESGYGNIHKSDIPNLMEMLTTLTKHLHNNILKMGDAWEFGEK